MMKILLWIVALPFILLALFIVLRFAFCRPNYFVVKTATPVVEKIADYIVEHGLPERLDEIPDLPYKLEGCSVNNKMWDKNDNIVVSKKEANKSLINEICYFSENKNLYKIELWLVKFNSNRKNLYGELKIVSKKTSVGSSFKSPDGKKFIFDGIGTGHLKTSGICQPFKQ